MTEYDRLKTLFRRHGVLSLSDGRCSSFPRAYFTRLVDDGFVQRIGAGVYSCPEYEGSETMDYVEAQMVVPLGVVCLFSALRIHGVTLENPHRTHLAVPRGIRNPKTALPVDFHSFSGDAYSFGIETRRGKDGEFKVYSVEKTIADCFKFRNSVGVDVAVAALKDAENKGLVDREKLWQALKACRVSRVARPYLDGVYA